MAVHRKMWKCIARQLQGATLYGNIIGAFIGSILIINIFQRDVPEYEILNHGKYWFSKYCQKLGINRNGS